MNTKWLIEEQTLKDIADSIRTMENSTDAIPVEDYSTRIGGIEPTVEEYMRITDRLNYPIPLNELNYTAEEVSKCKVLINFYAEMEETNV